MGEVIDPTLIVYTFDGPAPDERVEAGLARVRDHYQEIAHEPLRRHAWAGRQTGVVAFDDPGYECAWPDWCGDETVVLAGGYVPTGWERLVGSLEPAAAALRLAHVLRDAPERAALELNAPLVSVVVDRRAERVLILNDRLGAGRLYEMRFEGGHVWSNRLGVLPLFSGEEPRPDRRGWSLFAANGWFMRDSTPLEGARKVPPASIVEISDGEITRRTTDAAAQILAGRSRPFEDLVEQFAAEAQGALVAANALYADPPRVDLSGGRDSRVSAAAAIAAGVPAQLRTSDVNPGEADIARQLVAAAPVQLEHRVKWGGDKVKRRTTDLRERALASFRLHDGMRYAGKVRGRLQLPPPAMDRATISGHGGEIGHGFYYTNEKKLHQAQTGGFDGMVDRLLTSCRRTHGAAHDEVYDLARTEFEAALHEGEEVGLEGPELLDWYYLMDRFAHRSGIAAHTQRITVFSTPSFLVGAFALTPRDRLDAKLHHAAIHQLVPEWSEVPFFKASRGTMPKTRRARIWEGADGRAMSKMIKQEESWTELFDERRVKRLWRRARIRRGRGEWEQVFERIACRVAFDDYAALIRRRLG